MSMWLELVKIDLPLLAQVRHNRELIAALFRGPGEDMPPLPGFRRGADAYGHDYRIISAIAESRAEVEEGSADWTVAYPWLAMASGHGGEVVDEYEFVYGPAFVLTPDEARQVAQGLVAEGWARRAVPCDWDETSEDDGFEDLAPFFAAAAAEGKAVLGGVN